MYNAIAQVSMLEEKAEASNAGVFEEIETTRFVVVEEMIFW